MKRFLQAIAILVLAAGICAADDTGTVKMVKSTQGSPSRYTITWTAGTNNDSVTAATAEYVRGELLRAVFIPISPTGDYTIVIQDGYGVDILSGQGTGLSSNQTSHLVPGVSISDSVTTGVVPVAVNDLLTVAVTNCGNSASGQVILYSR